MPGLEDVAGAPCPRDTRRDAFFNDATSSGRYTDMDIGLGRAGMVLMGRRRQAGRQRAELMSGDNWLCLYTDRIALALKAGSIQPRADDTRKV